MDTQVSKKSVTAEDLKLAKDDPVNFLFAKLQERATDYCLDGDDKPCLEIKDDPAQKLYRLMDDQGKPTQRIRAFLRGVYRYETGEQLHLGIAEMLLLIDYLLEEAFRGGRKMVRTEPKQEGDFNFESVVVFANSLRSAEDETKGLGNNLLAKIVGAADERLKPKITRNVEHQTLVAELRTSDLWRAVNSPEIAVQVQADKKTLFNAINFFSRRLAELADQFRKVGLEVVLSHRDSGSWVKITRQDQVFQPDQSILVTADGAGSSSSGPSSGTNINANKTLEQTDDNRIQVEAPKPAAA